MYYNKNTKNLLVQKQKKRIKTMFVCKICDEEYDENMRYSRDSRYCKKCGEERTQYLTYRRDTLASLRSMPLEAKIIQTKFLIN